MDHIPQPGSPRLLLLMTAGAALLSGARVYGTPSTREDCAINLRQISSAAQQWAVVYRMSPTNAFPLQDTNVWQFLKGGTMPLCPDGGAYDAGRMLTDEPTCSLHGSLIEVDRRDARWRRLKQFVRVRYLALLCVVSVVGLVIFRRLRPARLGGGLTSIKR